MNTAAIAERTKAIHDQRVVVDTVNRSVMDDAFFQHIKEGGIGLLGRTILVSSGDVFSPFGYAESLRDITQTLQIIDAHPNELVLVKSAADIKLARETRRTGLYIYFQSPEPFETQLWRVRLFYELGLRVVQLTYNQRCLVGDGCAERIDGGLSDLGVELIKTCNDLGIVVDVSHCGHRTTMEAMELSKTPVLFTHANSRVLCDNRRCKTDEEVKRCAQQGGVIGVQALRSFLGGNEPTLGRMLDHIDHYVKLVGIDHVGLGLDLTTGHEFDDFGLLGYKPEMYQGLWKDGVQLYLEGMENVGKIPAITRGLFERGYSDTDVRKIVGDNFARVLGQIWG